MNENAAYVKGTMVVKQKQKVYEIPTEYNSLISRLHILLTSNTLSVSKCYMIQ